MSAILGHLSVELLTLDAFPEIGDIPETGDTLKENAFIKAKTVHQLTGLSALADETGLEVDALNGAPGIYSARYAGPDATFDDNCQKMLKEMSDIPEEKRTARFRTVIAFVSEGGKEWENKYPNWSSSEKETQMYLYMIREVMGGIDDKEREKNKESIIRNISSTTNIKNAMITD